MMDKQIEEICPELNCKKDCKYYGKSNCYRCNHKDICQLRTFSYCEEKAKEHGCEYYQQEIPEDSVVLSKEEWDRLMGDTYTSKEVDEIVTYKERVKAREVAQNILTRLADDFDVAGMDVEYPLHRVKIYAKEYGVEVE